MVTIHGTRRIFDGRVVGLRVDDVQYANGHRSALEVVEHRGGVAVIAQPQPQQIILVHQYRPAIGRSLWEVPAGKLEPDEAPLACATRELIEETGYRCKRMRHVWTFYTAPGFCTELLHLYAAEELTAGTSEPEASEQIEIRAFDVDAAWRLVVNDELPDAKTQIALAWARAKANSG